jgi:AcrR family transcriptional regulator
MARPKSDERRIAIMSAATRVIAAQGLGAPTSLIAKEAGVSNGSLFTYFQTKADLLNDLYVDLKTEMAAASLDGLPTEAEVREQMAHMSARGLQWAIASPEKRRALAHLSVSEEVTAESREIGHRAMSGVARLLERSRENGPMREAPLALMVGLMNAVADATVDCVLRDPAHADELGKAGFEAMWRMLA